MTESISSVRPAAPSSFPAMAASLWNRESTTSGVLSAWCLASMSSMLAWGTKMLAEGSSARSSIPTRTSVVILAPAAVVRWAGSTSSSIQRTGTSPSRAVSPGCMAAGSVTGTSLRLVPFRDFMSITHTRSSLRKNLACTRLTALELMRMSAAAPRPMVVPASERSTVCFAPSTSRMIFITVP